jgi:hypothetical protein
LVQLPVNVLGSTFAPLQEAIHKQTAKEIIRDKLVSLIASGILQVGDELPSERELAAMLSASASASPIPPRSTATISNPFTQRAFWSRPPSSPTPPSA